jgi:hypothetical protein
VGQTVVATHSFAVHLETSFGLRCGGSSGTLLKASTLSAGGQAGHVRFGNGSEADDEQGRKRKGEETTHRIDS